MMLPEYKRDANGDVLTRVVEIPYRPEFLTFFGPGAGDLREVPWRDRPLVPVGGTGGSEWPKDEPWPTGALREGEAFPDPLLSHMWAIDERICQRHGFSMLHVARIELPVLDYARADELTMRVHVHVLDDFATHANTCRLGCGVDYEPGRCAEGDRLADTA